MPKLTVLIFFIEKSKGRKKIKFCFVTATEKYYEPYRKEIADILGENCFIQKPITVDNLAEKVKKELKKSYN